MSATANNIINRKVKLATESINRAETIMLNEYKAKFGKYPEERIIDYNFVGCNSPEEEKMVIHEALIKHGYSHMDAGNMVESEYEKAQELISTYASNLGITK